MQSAGDPEMLPEGAVARAMNMVRRGGIYQCRPGYRERLLLPEGTFQGFTWFRPSGGEVQFIFVIDGKVYLSTPPFDGFVEITGIALSNRVREVYFERAEQSVIRNDDNSLTLINPQAVLMIQDGKSAPAYWDGAKGGHIRGDETTPIGTHMVWSGGRLWVANGRRVFASDIYDPFSFREGQYIGPSGINAFILPGEVTGMTETPSVENPLLLVFTKENTTAFQSNLRDRDAWAQTPDFQKVVFPDVGCASARSIVAHFGYLWWFSPKGAVNINLAVQTQTSSERKVIDTNMVWSKQRLDPDLSGVAAGAYLGYLLISVPYADKWNRHTWVADLEGLDTTIEEEGPTWDSFWVGTRPVQWVTANIAGQDRIFQVSYDRDGRYRMWEAFMHERLDNFTPITWALETRGYLFGTKQPKQWKYAKLSMSEFWDETHLKISWAGTTRGRYKQSCTKIVKAQRGVIRASDIYTADTKFFGFKKQSRTVSTVDTRQSPDDSLDSCGVESDRTDPIDYGFQLCVMGSGPGGIRTIRVFATLENDEQSGVCEKNESNVRVTRFDGAASAGDSLEEALEALLLNPPQIWESCATVMESYGGYTATGVACETSVISAAAAANRAKKTAEARAAEDLRVYGPKFFGGFKSGICFPTTQPFV